jgi:hypothetical protein
MRMESRQVLARLLCLVSEELQEELVVTHPLAPGSVEALEQCCDDAFLDCELGF